jgi:hypothetical protein
MRKHEQLFSPTFSEVYSEYNVLVAQKSVFMGEAGNI